MVQSRETRIPRRDTILSYVSMCHMHAYHYHLPCMAHRNLNPRFLNYRLGPNFLLSRLAEGGKTIVESAGAPTRYNFEIYGSTIVDPSICSAQERRFEKKDSEIRAAKNILHMLRRSSKKRRSDFLLLRLHSRLDLAAFLQTSVAW
jgi:hypothetical protein